MGQCFGKKKKNKLSPSPIEDIDVDASLSRGTPFQQATVNKVQYADMAKDLAEDQDAKVTGGGISYAVDFKNGDVPKMPQRLASRIDGAVTSHNDEKIEYTKEEKELLVEMMRDDFLESRRQTAWRNDVRQFDAARRRASLATDKALRTKSFLDKATPTLKDRLQKVKDMTEESRSKVKVIEVKPAAVEIDNVKKD